MSVRLIFIEYIVDGIFNVYEYTHCTFVFIYTYIYLSNRIMFT